MLRLWLALGGVLILLSSAQAQESTDSDPPVPEWARTAPAPADDSRSVEPEPTADPGPQVDPSEASDPAADPGGPGATVQAERPRTIPATHRWPRGGATFRGLPPCEPGALIPSAYTGQPYTCHPPFRDPGMEVVNHFVLAPGVGFAGDDVDRAFAGGFDLSIFPTRGFGIGAEWLAVRMRQTGHDRDGDGLLDDQTSNLRLHHITARLLARVYTDESARRSFGFFAQGGYAFSLTDRVPNMPVVGGGLTWSFGAIANGDFAADLEIGLRYLQGLGAGERSEYRSVLMTFGVGFASRLHAPRNFSERPVSGPFRFSFAPVVGVQKGHGAMVTGEVGIGLSVHPVLEPRLRAELGALTTDDARSELRAPYSRVVLGSAGLRAYLRMGVPLWAEVGAGAIGVFGDTPREIDPGAFADMRAGVTLVGCGGGVTMSLRYRAGVAGGYRGEHFFGVGLEFTVGNYAHLKQYARRTSWTASCPAPAPGRNPEPPAPPPPPPAPVPEVETSTEIQAGVDVQVRIPEVAIEIEPVTIEVVIGYVLFGGALDMRLNVASLPLQQLRSAGWVEVQIVGPPAARARARAELNAVLDREGVRVDAQAEAEGEGAVQAVKAVFTLWPAGTQPGSTR